VQPETWERGVDLLAFQDTQIQESLPMVLHEMDDYGAGSEIRESGAIQISRVINVDTGEGVLYCCSTPPGRSNHTRGWASLSTLNRGVMMSKEIDALIAEHILNNTEGTLKLPAYSTSIEDAWRVVEYIDSCIPRIERIGGRGTYMKTWFALEKGVTIWQAGLKYIDDYGDEYFRRTGSEEHESAPMAICLAALRIFKIKPGAQNVTTQYDQSAEQE